ncbi:MAG: serine/threonine protein kinase [Planctomycetales bacterium]|nr:serine/threonine protein kinase [Planctomycetales bacterium]
MTNIKNFLGPYRLARLIRVGNSCQVWEAIEAESQGRFALKVLREDFRENKAELSFLRNEFSIANKMEHPNVIKMFELILSGSSPFLVLELFSELNMKQALRRGPDSIAFMLDKILVQCLEGLGHMHSKGFVHCDVKPDNFLCSRTGEVKLIDFTISQKIKKGIAKIFGGKSKCQGTRSYMSPEQIRGGYLDGRTDIYSLGCVFYEMVTGKPPFTGENPNDLLNKHISAPIPNPMVANDNVNPDFANIIRSMLSKKPEDRPETMTGLATTIRAIRLFRKQPQPPETSIFDEFPTAGRM